MPEHVGAAHRTGADAAAAGLEAEAVLAEGWYRFEPENALRWTDGDAAIPASIFAGMTDAGTLIVQMGATTQYIDDGKAEMAA